MASSVVDIDPDGDPDTDGGQASASLSFEQYDIFVPQQRLETFDIAIMKERGPYTDDIANFMECSFHDKQMIGTKLNEINRITIVHLKTFRVSGLHSPSYRR